MLSISNGLSSISFTWIIEPNWLNLGYPGPNKLLASAFEGNKQKKQYKVERVLRTPRGGEKSSEEDLNHFQLSPLHHMFETKKKKKK